jgi:GH15 family glucan-1,4-alpha-glucosidase
MGIIGNCSYLAYIDKQASVVWMCMPRFDSSFIFGSLLDKKMGGEFSITPVCELWETHQYYIKNTNILCTEFYTSTGNFRVTDFAPRFLQYDRYYRPHMMIRKIEPLSDTPVIRVTCKPRDNYGKLEPEMVMGSNHIRYLNMSSHARLTTNIPVNYIMQDVPILLNETKYLVFTYGPALEAPIADTVETFLSKTQSYWMEWIKATSISNMFQESIIRSALVLKLHQYEDTGGIIASGTTSLPEFDKSTRNWDYRYCWLRDTYFTLTAFNNIGHFEELERYFHFIQNTTLREKSLLQPLYTITGGQDITEQAIDLSGYLENQPVRIGNAAYLQSQHDSYGLVLASLLPLFIDKRLDYDSNKRQHILVHHLLDCIEEVIDQPDAGIWEFRGTLQFNSYTYLCHWVGCKTAYKIANALNDERLASQAQRLTNKSIQYLERCYNHQESAYMQAVDSLNHDASTLQMILLKYLDTNSSKAKKHLQAIEKNLGMNNGLIHRYIHKDDFGVPKTTFLACAFWYAEALACVGRIDDSIGVLEGLQKYSNHLGLFSEHVDIDGSQWGNFPQTYSHVGLMNAAYRIASTLNLPSFM